jgi:hypothetical protein
MAGIDRGTHYDWLQDPEYKAQFEAAQLQAADMLEEEAIRRAYHGIEKPVTIAGKREVIHEHSDTLLIFLLKGARPQKYRDNVRQEISGPGGAAVIHRVILERVDLPMAQLDGSGDMSEYDVRSER